jgi:succinyl-CoA synthetase beta subunit
MHIHEYQAKALFKRYSIPVLTSTLVNLHDDLSSICEKIGDQEWMVKAQVHAGGRGKAGGIVRVKDKNKLLLTMSNLLGSRLVTKQTGENGLPVNSLLLESTTEIKKEFYLALLIDRSKKRIAIIASAEGGVDIEQVAQQSPEKIITIYINPVTRIQANQVRSMGFALKLENDQIKQLDKVVRNLYDLFISYDCSLVEVNPLIANNNNTFIALDAKIIFDDNAIERHQDISKLYDRTQENTSEAKAKELGLSYVKLDGNIGCIVNGAGLAMATMDLVKHHGGAPANFLDVGGGATQEKVTHAFKLVISDTNVKSIFVNIFGGIVQCDLIAQGILTAINEIDLQVTVVVLLQGTNSLEGKKLLENVSSRILPVENLTEGAQQAIQLASA